MTTRRGDKNAAGLKSLPFGCASRAGVARMVPWGSLSLDELRRRRTTLFKRRRGAQEVTSHTVAHAFASGVHSTGFLSLDELLSRAGVGNSSGGGVLCSRLTEVYGPPMAGKSYLVRRIVTTFIRKMEQLRVTPTLGTQTAQGSVDDASGNVEWDVYICLTGGDGEDSGGAQHAGRAEGWHTLQRDLELPTPSISKAGCAALSCPGATVHVHDSYIDAHMHFVRPTHPNDLLAVLSWLAFAEPALTRCDDGTSGRHVLLVIDSLTSMWLHPALRTRTSTHAMRWFAAELHRLLRCCLHTHPTPGGSAVATSAAESVPAGCAMADAPRRTVTAITVNGCGSYNFRIEPPAVNELLPNWDATSTWAAFPPKPLGEEGWWRAVDYRLLVEPAAPSAVALLAPILTRKDRDNDAEQELDATHHILSTFQSIAQNSVQASAALRTHAKASLVKGGSKILFSVPLTDDLTMA